MEIKLKELSINDGQEVFDFLASLPEEENGFYNPGYQLSREEFSWFLEKKSNEARGINLKEGYVPQTIYWLYIDNEIVGVGKLRHYLNKSLQKDGGHIGYGIASDFRGKGYGKLLLRELLKKAGEIGLSDILLTCDEDNSRSRGVIEANNGILEKIEEGKCSYWISLS